MSTSPLSGLPPQQVLTQFQQGAEQGSQLWARLDGQALQVRAEGSLPGSAAGGSRRVAWVHDDVDTTGMFVQALAAARGPRLAEAIAESLGLDPAPGKPLAARAVQQALDMADAGREALAGVDFLTRLEHSAVCDGVAFRQAAVQAGVDPARIDATGRASLDAQLDGRFATAAAQGQSPVSPEAASIWLRELIADLPA